LELPILKLVLPRIKLEFPILKSHWLYIWLKIKTQFF
jgi:hypothetical protein